MLPSAQAELRKKSLRDWAIDVYLCTSNCGEVTTRYAAVSTRLRAKFPSEVGTLKTAVRIELRIDVDMVPCNSNAFS
jgi:hypothetical protein